MYLYHLLSKNIEKYRLKFIDKYPIDKYWRQSNRRSNRYKMYLSAIDNYLDWKGLASLYGQIKYKITPRPTVIIWRHYRMMVD